VRALALSGPDLYVGGSFGDIGGQDRNRIARLSTTGSAVADPTWNPDANGPVFALAVSGTDLYAGGDFSSAGAAKLTRNNIARLNADGSLDPTWDPNANGSVLALAVSGSDVYVGGAFNGVGSIGGQDRRGIAKLSTTGSGAADPTWNPNANSTVFALAVSGPDLYVGGLFSGANSIGGQGRNRIAKLSTTGTGAADPTWNPNANNWVTALAVSGTELYVGGFFAGANSIGGQDRNRIAKLSTTGTGAADPTWNPDAKGQVFALAVSASDLYVGGNFGSIGRQDRNGIAKLSTTGSGDADPTWDPRANSAVFALAASDRWLAIGGQFSAVGPLSTEGVALFDLSAPAITITAPADGATYTQGQSVAASYTCTEPDGAGDIATCNGPVASGAPIDTSTAGAHTFTVTATDQAGNSTSQTANYAVVAASAGGDSGGVGGSSAGGGGGSALPIPLVAAPSIGRSGKVSTRLRGRAVLVDPGIKVTCPPGGESCTANETATARATAKLARAKPTKLTIARAHFTIPAGASRELVFKLNRAGASALRRHRRLRATVAVGARTGTGPTTTSTKTITIKRPARKR
jgi:hypothetical protein